MADDVSGANGNGNNGNGKPSEKPWQWTSETAPRKPGPGRPKGSISITTMLRIAGNAQNGKRARALARKIWEEAEAGNPRFAELLLDRIDGKVTQPVDMNVSARPIQVADNPAPPELPAQSSDMIAKLRNGDAR